MAKKKKNKHHKKIGQAPGTLIYTGEKANNLAIEVFDYNTDKFEEKDFSQIENTFIYKSTDAITWININGLNHIDDIEKIGNHYNLHPLILEDIVNTSQRPKIDEYDDYIFVVLKMLYYSAEGAIISEQVSFILGSNYVLTFQ
ncbi:MAG: magnesium and cobalt transport protein CorA, partial [Flavobacteriaceae bacterium]|nr:magnesium and cobalt transport protein CorA [Flavobacteriaceae bacterium]